MNDAAIKNFCTWARRELVAQVRIQAMRFGIRDDGYDPAGVNVIEGRPLSEEQMRQRADLIQRLGAPNAEGYKQAYESLIDKAAYTWFNRLVAIRYMEVNDRLPSHVRMLSAADGSFDPQVVREALDVTIEGVDSAQVSQLVVASDDEALFRYMFLAQCAELSSCMPDVFEPVGAALELLLPEGLLRQGGVVERLITDIPEEDWREGVQIVGWMYQYYNAELKDEAFASFKKGKKADREALKPATQLFTPDWIVRYLVENSVGRLWMQSHPNSSLPEHMPYFVPDEDEAADVGDVPVSPEGITVIDPACGSGHILVYAFELLANMYEEAGYTRRDIPRLVLERNLTGLEIDPRAAQLASFALTMTACNYDSRFLRRGVYPKVLALKQVDLEEEDLQLVPMLADRAKLLDAMAHMSECGSLFTPDEADMQAISDAESALEDMTDLFAAKALEKVREMRANCEPLYEKYSAVVANPPYMGSSNMDKWLANWTKKNYPDSKRDLCTCFIERGFTLTKEGGYSAMVTMESWMFLSSFESMRKRILEEHSIVTLVYMNHMVMRIAFNTSATVFRVKAPGQVGSYTKVEYADLNEEAQPNTFPIERHGVYRRDAEAFSTIPGTPIAYWASDAMIRAFEEADHLAACSTLPEGIKTGDNDRFLRLWWECYGSTTAVYDNHKTSNDVNDAVWFPCNKGGQFRKWFGNNEYLLNFKDKGKVLFGDADIDGRSVSCYAQNLIFEPLLTWTRISSGELAVRFAPYGSMSETTGPAIFSSEEVLKYVQAFLNSSVASQIAGFLSPTLDFRPGQLARYPLIESEGATPIIHNLVESNRTFSKNDWDSFETSWDFKRHPMV